MILIKKFNIIVAIQLIADTWAEVSEQTIINYWIKSSLVDKEEVNKYFNSEYLAIVDWFLEEPNIIADKMETHEICKKNGFDYFDFENMTKDNDLYQFKKN